MKRNIKPRVLDFWNFCFRYCERQIPSHLSGWGQSIIDDKELIVKLEGDKGKGITTLAGYLSIYYALMNPGYTIFYISRTEEYSYSFKNSVKGMCLPLVELVHYNHNAFHFQNDSRVITKTALRPEAFLGHNDLIVITDNLTDQEIKRIQQYRFNKMIILSSSPPLKHYLKDWYGFDNSPWVFKK